MVFLQKFRKSSRQSQALLLIFCLDACAGLFYLMEQLHKQSKMKGKASAQEVVDKAAPHAS
jgi:hypothetical protein